MKKSILLSIDVEEFDIAGEYGQIIEENTQFEVSLNGLKAILVLLEELTATWRYHRYGVNICPPVVILSPARIDQRL